MQRCNSWKCFLPEKCHNTKEAHLFKIFSSCRFVIPTLYWDNYLLLVLLALRSGLVNKFGLCTFCILDMQTVQTSIQTFHMLASASGACGMMADVCIYCIPVRFHCWRLYFIIYMCTPHHIPTANSCHSHNHTASYVTWNDFKYILYCTQIFLDQKAFVLPFDSFMTFGPAI